MWWIVCILGVVIADIEVFFQRDPFVANVEPYPIMLFEEHPDARTTHWLVDFTVGKCRDKKFDKPMISAGILMGSRKGMLYFLTRMVNEFHAWGENANCHFPFNGDVQVCLCVHSEVLKLHHMYVIYKVWIHSIVVA